VGAYFQKCTFDTKGLVVRAMLPGGPMENCGQVQIGDVLLEVDGADMYGKGMSHVVPLLLGDDGSEVTMTFAKPGVFNGMPPASLAAVSAAGKPKVEVRLTRGTQVA